MVVRKQFLPLARVSLVLVLFVVCATNLDAQRFHAKSDNVTAFAAGSYVIPMDVGYQNYGMWKAYGLVYRLLRAGIPVHWAIQGGKAFGGVDFTATSVDQRTSAPINGGAPYGYAGGPFIIAQANTAAALPIIQSWWAANANQPAVHRVTAGFSADIDIVLQRAPLIALESINSGIAIAYFNAAGIPDSTGAVWTSASTDVMSQTRIANGELFQSGACSTRKYDIFVTPHNSGYPYSRTDPTNLGTRTYAALDYFVYQGGGWVALCHSILSNENYIWDLYANSEPAVRALFYSTENTGFLTRTGFGNIANGGGIWTVNPAATDLPIAQAVPTPSATQALPGGSVQTWLSTSVTYLPAVERVAWFQNGGLQYDWAVNGVYHGGDGRGKLTFLGGHSYSTSVPYASNFEAPYLRYFFNALFFNGAAVANLGIVASPVTVPQGYTTPIALSVKNTGASVATGVDNLQVTLANGVSYTGMIAGPAPTSVTPGGGGTTILTFPPYGDLAGGATAVTIGASVSYNSVGTYQLATLQGNYGDVFSEAFATRDCFSLVVTPAPALAITKNPATQTGVLAGQEVTWTLTYTNTGPVDALSGMVEDILPAGFSIDTVATDIDDPVTTPAPASIVPLADGTTRVRWNVGTIAKNGGTGTITLVAYSATPAGASQTYTNTVTVSGRDAAGNSFTSAPATATVTVVAPKLSMTKTASPTEALPGQTVTFTMTPTYTDTYPLSNAIVTDPVPLNTTYVANSANASGFLDGTSVKWVLGSNDPGAPGITAESGYAYCPVTVDLLAVADTYIDANSPTSNFGTANEFMTRPAAATKLKHTLIRFDTSAIPANAVVISANLGLTVNTARATNHVDQIRMMTTSWTETGTAPTIGATWNTRDGQTAWAAGVFSSADYAPTVYGSIVPATTGLKIATVTDAVKIWTASPATNRGFVLLSTGTDGGDAKYASRTNGTTSKRPYLRVVYLQKSLTACSGTLSATNLADTYIDKSNQATNYGTLDRMWTNPGNNNTGTGTKYSLFRFDVSAIPPGATITSATLGVTVKTNRASNHTDVVNRVLTSWTETGASWTRRDGTNMWASGTTFGTSDYDATSYGSIIPDPNGLKTVNVTTLVNGWINGGLPNNGIVLRSTGTDTGDAKYATKEEATLADRPTLTVNWSVPLSTAPGTENIVTVSPLLVTGSGTVTVKMSVRPTGGSVQQVSPPANLIVQASGINSFTKLTGPDPTGPVTLVSGTATEFTWTYNVVAGSQPGSIVFAGAPTSTQSPTVTFANSNSVSVIVTPPLTFQATVNIGIAATVNQTQNVAVFSDDAVGSANATALVTIRQPLLSLVKSVTPTGEISPTQTLTYTLTLTNDGSGQATNVTITDPLPANVSYVGCTAAYRNSVGDVVNSSCTYTAPNIIFSGFTIPPQTTFTAKFTVAPLTSLGIGTHTVNNTASLTATQLPTPVSSNTVTNTIRVVPLLTIVKSQTSNSPYDADGRVVPGNVITYTLVVTNAGGVLLNTVQVTDAVPAGTTYVASSLTCARLNPDAACGALSAAGPLTAHVGPLAVGQRAEITYQVTVNTPAVDGTTILNNASVTSAEIPSGVQSNDVSYAIEAAPLISVTKSASPASGTQVTPGSTITYTLLVLNNGTANTLDAYIRDSIPTGTTYVAGSTTLNGFAVPEPMTPPPVTTSLTVFSPGMGDSDGDSGILSVGVPNGAVITFRVTVDTPNANGTIISNQTVAGTPTLGEVTSNLVTHPVFATPVLTVAKSVSPAGQIYPGQALTYSVTLTNTGNLTATNVTLSDAVPVNSHYIAASASDGGAYDSGTNTVSWTGLTLVPGASLIRTFQVSSTTLNQSDYTITNVATASYTRYMNSSLDSAITATPLSNEVLNIVIVPTAVTLRDFEVLQASRDILVTWRTDFEADNLGFNVWREQDGVRTKLNKALIAGSSFVTKRAAVVKDRAYRFRDKLPADGFVQYWLEDVDTNGTSTLHGPVGPTPTAMQLEAADVETLQGLGIDGNVLQSPEGSGVMRAATLGPRSRAELKAQRDVAGGPSLKIFVARQGWYRLTRAAMTAAGFDPGRDSSTLSLSMGGADVAIVVDDGGDRSFDSNDAIEFYGFGLDTISTGARTYWLRNRKAPLRITSALSGGAPSPTSVPFVYQRKDRTLWAADLTQTGEDGFVGPVIGSWGAATQQLPLGWVDTSAPEEAMLELVVRGGTSLPHRVQVSLNGRVIGLASFEGLERSAFTLPLRNADLVQGTNTLSLLGTAGDRDITVLLETRVRYQHLLRADNGLLEATFPAARSITVTGFASASIRAFDVTDPTKPLALQVTPAQVADGWSATFATPLADAPRQVIVFGSDRILTQTELAANTPSSLSATLDKVSADLLILSHRSFATAAGALQTARAAEGIASAIIDIDDVYDEYGFGMRSAEAIRDFVKAKRESKKPPRWLLLVGDASIDPRGYLGMGEYDFVPTKLVTTAYLKTASDDWLADFDGDGIADVPVGRIPVRTAGQASTVIGRIATRGTPSGPWASRVLFVADYPDTYPFGRVVHDTAPLLPATIAPAFVEFAQSTAPATDLRRELETGALVVNYVGHGSTEIWRSYSIFSSATAATLTNGGRAPFVVSMTCLNGYFHDLWTESLAEALLKAPAGGAVGVWASSTLTNPEEQEKMNAALFRMMFNAGVTVGEAIMNAKRATEDRDVRSSWNLFGDPSMKVRP